MEEPSKIRKMTYALIGGDLRDVRIGHFITHAKRPYLVLKWTPTQSGTKLMPARTVCLEAQRFQEPDDSLGHFHYTLNDPLPPQILADDISLELKDKYGVCENLSHHIDAQDLG